MRTSSRAPWAAGPLAPPEQHHGDEDEGAADDHELAHWTDLRADRPATVDILNPEQALTGHLVVFAVF